MSRPYEHMTLAQLDEEKDRLDEAERLNDAWQNGLYRERNIREAEHEAALTKEYGPKIVVVAIHLWAQWRSSWAGAELIAINDNIDMCLPFISKDPKPNA